MFSGFVISCEDIARLYAFHLTVSDVGNRYSEEVVGLIDTGSDASIVSQRLIEKLH